MALKRLRHLVQCLRKRACAGGEQGLRDGASRKKAAGSDALDAVFEVSPTVRVIESEVDDVLVDSDAAHARKLAHLADESVHPGLVGTGRKIDQALASGDTDDTDFDLDHKGPLWTEERGG